tara:strand:- start:738 stop:1244 length:507 start_codon:yes stop_codon:yes gene_type:complete
MRYLLDKALVIGHLVLLLSWTVNAADNPSVTTASVSAGEAPLLDTYKSANCGCCQKWIDHAEHAGFKINAHNTNSLNQTKADYGILPQYQSCHTSVSKDGFIFEGHIPASLIKRFLANPPTDAIGLAAPGMPMGSPGMEMGNTRDDYVVLLLNSDGSSIIYEQIIAPK